MNKTNQYKIGDRVVYHAGERSGNHELDGWVGTVIGTDTSRMPYTVEFDEAYAGAMEDERFGGRKGHCWHCAEEHLSAAGVSQPGGSSAGKRTRQAVWSEEELLRLKEMKEAGRTAKEIGQALGRTEHAVAFQWTMIKRRARGKEAQGSGGQCICDTNTDGQSRTPVPTEKERTVEKREQCICDANTDGQSRTPVPTREKGISEREHSEASRSSPSTEKEIPESGSGGEEGRLNGMEQALSEVIRELKGENDALQGENAKLRQTCSESAARILQLTEETLRLTETATALRGELEDTAGALASTEGQLDELRRELQEVRSTLKHTEKLLVKQENAYREDTELLYQREVRIKTMEQLIADKDERIERLETRLSRATRVALGVTEKLLLGGEERI